MKSKIIVPMAYATVSLFFAASCSTSEKKKEAREISLQEIKSSPMAGSLYTTIVFHKGDAELSSFDREELRSLTEKAHKKKKPIEEIKILAWADKEYPHQGANDKASVKDVTLASERAFKIRDYLEKNLSELEDIDSYNMAKRPSVVSKLFKNDEYALKEVFEKSGATGTKLPNGSVSYTKASKALVIIKYEDDENN